MIDCGVDSVKPMRMHMGGKGMGGYHRMLNENGESPILTPIKQGPSRAVIPSMAPRSVLMEALGP